MLALWLIITIATAWEYKGSGTSSCRLGKEILFDNGKRVTTGYSAVENAGPGNNVQVAAVASA